MAARKIAKKPKIKRLPGRPLGAKNQSKLGESYRISLIKLDAVDRAMLAIVGASPAISNSKLTKEIGLSLGPTKKRRDRAIFQAALSELQEEALEVVKNLQKRAAHRLRELINSDDEKIALGAIQTVLRPLLPRTSIVKNENIIDISIKNMDQKQLDNFIKKGLEGLNFNDVIDVSSKGPAEIPAEILTEDALS